MKPKIILCLAFVLSGGLFGFCWLILPEDVSLTKFASLANSKNQIWFYDDGFKERDLIFYVKPDGQKIKFVTHLIEDGAFHFSYAQWTKDGQAVVCSFQGRAVGNVPTMGISYDFSTGKAKIPRGCITHTKPIKPTGVNLNLPSKSSLPPMVD